MLQKDEGIVLRSTRSGETSVVVTFLGAASGKVRLMAKGALGAKSAWRGLFEPGNHLEVVYYHKEARSLYYIREASAASAPSRRRDSLPHLASRLAAMEVLDQVCYHQSPDAHIVDIAADFVRLGDAADPLFVFLAFEIKLLYALGAAPEVTSCAVCGTSPVPGMYSPRDGVSVCREHAGGGEALALDRGMVDLIERCASAPFTELAQRTVEPALRKQLGKLTHWTYTHHIHGYSLPKSLNLI